MNNRQRADLKQKAFAAAFEGNDRLLLSCFRKGLSIHARDHDDWTLLMAAAAGLNVSTVCLLIGLGCKLNACDPSSKRTASHVAALNSLRKKGEDLESSLSKGFTILTCLEQAGARTMRDANGKTPEDYNPEL
jgi:ankyrin repeat protein